MKKDQANCPTCGQEVDARSFILDCDHCLSKMEE